MEEGGNTRKRVKREKNESSLENRLEFASERFCHNRHKPFVHCPDHVEYPFWVNIWSFHSIAKKKTTVLRKPSFSFFLIIWEMMEDKASNIVAKQEMVFVIIIQKIVVLQFIGCSL